MNSQTPTKDHSSFMPLILSKLFRLSHSLLFDPAFFWFTAACLLIGEALLNIFIIKYVPCKYDPAEIHTEIDWKAYMKEVSIFLNGERNYTNIQGDTGPCVYPAGFVYIYSILYYITSEGVDIPKAQYIFAILYMWTLYVVFNIYRRCRQAFEFSRVFLYKWTVNWKFFMEETFLSSGFSKVLLVAHVWVLLAFLFGSWCRSDDGVPRLLHLGFFGKPSEIAKRTVTADQYCWNVYPATSESSSLLFACHLMILMGLWSGDSEGRRIADKN
ncbi:5783_t:CDS:2 [Cetraspora pellucida]|uniref:Dol-P-Man:Man(5)GlcNAc(2)-PP-Dol alpha-1,3-mannosyltransferase n=1 Tax=Cetraspora pellucida TaxID=1433469 RepID=A0A9N9EK86_9GLOM|nr:5783_t:CDS:2 [Cetraspora pellucida]